MKLWEVSEEIVNLEDKLMDFVDPETGEIIDEEGYNNEEARLSELFASKLDDGLKYIRSLDAQIKTIQNEERLFKAKRDVLTKKKDRYRKYLMYHMESTGKKKLSTDLFTVSIRESEKVTCDKTQLEKIDDKFIRTKVTKELDKTAVKNFVKETGSVPNYVLIEKSKSLVVK